MQERRVADVTRTILVFLVIVLSIGMVFELRVGLDNHRLLAKLDQASHVDDAAVLAGLPNPFEVLDEICTRCHSERRFGAVDMNGTEASLLLSRMERHPDLGLSAPQEQKLQAALIMQRCLGCHEDTAVKSFLAMAPYMRHGLVDHMIHSSGSTITRSDTEEILLAANRLSTE